MTNLENAEHWLDNAETCYQQDGDRSPLTCAEIANAYATLHLAEALERIFAKPVTHVMQDGLQSPTKAADIDRLTENHAQAVLKHWTVLPEPEKVTKECPHCNDGKDVFSETDEPCPTCKGTGTVEVAKVDEPKPESEFRKCEPCEGTGHYQGNPFSDSDCPHCKGAGKFYEPKDEETNGN